MKKPKVIAIILLVLLIIIFIIASVIVANSAFTKILIADIANNLVNTSLGTLLCIVFIAIFVIMIILAIDSKRLKKPNKFKISIGIICICLSFIIPVKTIQIDNSNGFIEYKHSFYKNIYGITILTDGCNCEVKKIQ